MEVPCTSVARRVRPVTDAPASEWTRWHSVVEIEGGPVHLSALPILEEGKPLGFVMLLHDFGFAGRDLIRLRPEDIWSRRRDLVPASLGRYLVPPEGVWSRLRPEGTWSWARRGTGTGTCG